MFDSLSRRQAIHWIGKAASLDVSGAGVAACPIIGTAIRRDDYARSHSLEGSEAGLGRKTSRAARRYRFCPTHPRAPPLHSRTQHPTSSALLSRPRNTSNRKYALTISRHSSKCRSTRRIGQPPDDP